MKPWVFSTEEIYDGGHSVARNPRIQTFFRMIGAGDNIGSGFPTILSAWGEENWRKPDLSENPELRQVDLKLWMISLMPPECTEHLQSLFGLAYSHLSNNEQIILGTAFLEGAVTNSRMQSMLDLHSTEIGRILGGLVDQQMLIADKKGRWTSYQLNEGYEIQPEQVNLTDLQQTEIVLKNDTDCEIYQYAKANGFITVSQVIQITRITSRQGAYVALNRLIKRGLLKASQRGNATVYKCAD